MLEDRLREIPLAEPARPVFRAELARRFASGQLETGHAAPLHRAARDPSPLLDRPASLRRPLSVGPFSWQAGLGLAAAAAAVVLLVRGTRERAEPLPPNNPIVDARPQWKLLRVGSAFAVDDARIATAGLDPIAVDRLLDNAECVSCYEEGLELELADELRLGLSPFSKVELPDERTPVDRSPDERIPDDPIADGLAKATCELEFVLDHGAMQIERKPRCGSMLVVSTPHAVIRIVGTVLDIEVVEGKGTCICVAEGSVEVLTLSGETQRIVVDNERSCFVFSDARAPVQGKTCDMAPPEHTAELRKFCEEP